MSLPNPFRMKVFPFNEYLLKELRCPKCLAVDAPVIKYMDSHVVFSAANLYYPECLRLICSTCQWEEWMHTSDYRAPTPEEIEASRKYYNTPISELLWGWFRNRKPAS